MAGQVIKALLVGIIVVHVAEKDVTNVNADQNCEADNECDKGSYCYNSGFCVACLDCKYYKRNADWKSCAKTATDCGRCFAGYEEEVLTDGTNKDFCVKMSATTETITESSTTNESLSKDKKSTFGSASISSVAAAVVILIFAGMYIHFRKKKMKQSQNSSQNLEEGIPLPTDPHAPTDLDSVVVENVKEEPPPAYNSEFGCHSSEHSFVVNARIETENKVKAVPFQMPDASYNLVDSSFQSVLDAINYVENSQNMPVNASQSTSDSISNNSGCVAEDQMDSSDAQTTNSPGDESSNDEEEEGRNCFGSCTMNDSQDTNCPNDSIAIPLRTSNNCSVQEEQQNVWSPCELDVLYLSEDDSISCEINDEMDCNFVGVNSVRISSNTDSVFSSSPNSVPSPSNTEPPRKKQRNDSGQGCSEESEDSTD